MSRLYAFLLCLALGACGHKEAHPHFADNEGVYVDAGPLTYQVQLSRELNPSNIEDQRYLSGLPIRFLFADSHDPGACFGVFR